MEITKAKVGHQDQFKDYVESCIADGLELYDEAKTDSSAYLKKRIAYSQGLGLPDGWAPITTYFCMESGAILGSIRVRHGTNEYIENVIGHIGYETRPTARGKGVASFLLAWVRDNVVSDSAIVTCSIENSASQKVIENCGGVYLGNYTDESEGTVRRYRLVRT
ncbi:GNAT family N-acetyltransferase [Vibrio sp. JPW-9-11-11]|uniref:GNAT family N-acetyltransferase n=1 Tax=Vibrio sp. JPW-9-11-11 TaxID=1416532 RepID=UPI001593EFC4|nr:GNAT family N-acetyltransferase [Vibrio sp. JPW-9-11-11]NVD08344.1 GNAT family N-acetyltransferase [Vibrio sp. JPW-9-11-11]